MSKPASSTVSSAWVGAPPVAAEGFAYAEGVFFAEASGQNRHGRASNHELKTHFTSGSDRDHPAHWFEAQLIHYGLKQSKNKAVARTRLLDALNSGSLTVPPHITRLEADLKKEWTRLNREAKKGSQTAGKATETAAGVKRKKDSTPEPASKKSKPAAAPKKQTPKPAADKKNAKKPASKTTAVARTTAAKQSSSTMAHCVGGSSQGLSRNTVIPSASSPPRPPRTKQTARCVGRGGSSQGLDRNTVVPPASPPPRTKQTARCVGRGGISRGSSRGTVVPSPSSPPPKKQTARRSGAFMARGRIPAPRMSPGTDNNNSNNSWDGRRGVWVEHVDLHYESADSQDEVDSDGDHYMHDDAPPPYSPIYGNDAAHRDEDGGGGLAPLGLLNGSYEVDCPYVDSEWPHYGSDFALTLTLAGRQLWGSFSLGVIDGVMYFPERPYQSSYGQVPFLWRGQEDNGPINYGNGHGGWVKFLGDGNIQGQFDYMSIKFTAYRLPGQGTRSDIDAATLKREWDGYTEARYEEENRSRWH
ncbi:hypothetical protein XA68_15570 [Ophiocordyceps unilateralis]|uniref:Uncharacterized protein n=1 Tax=Ophiocordyceps unilateralis TaxID=268505 RepID=A0A2A9P7Z4_OPHUN|nr:hypothetical protein XA68_15570 [Ophiocordyceps unilateralis]